MPCDTDDGWYCYTLESGFVHDVAGGVVRKHKRDASDKLITRSTFDMAQGVLGGSHRVVCHIQGSGGVDAP